MIGIETKVIPASNTRPRRICAFTCNGHRIIRPYDSDAQSDVLAHFAVAKALIAEQFDHPLPYQTMTYGGTARGYFFCWPQSTVGA